MEILNLQEPEAPPVAGGLAPRRGPPRIPPPWPPFRRLQARSAAEAPAWVREAGWASWVLD